MLAIYIPINEENKVMSKIKENLLHQQEVQMQYYSKFMDFVHDSLVSSKLSELDINKLEEEKNSPSAQKPILSKQALNNINRKVA